MVRHDTDETFSRREFLAMAAGGTIAAEETGRELQGKGDATTALDAATPHQVGDAVSKLDVDVSYGGETSSSTSERQTTETSTPTAAETHTQEQTPTPTPDYSGFAEGLQSQNSSSVEYVEGALEADPGQVETVEVDDEGLYVDSVLIEWDAPEMTDSMEQYLRSAAEEGNLAQELSNYETQNT